MDGRRDIQSDKTLTRWQKYKKLREYGYVHHPIRILWGLVWFIPLLLSFVIATGLVFFGVWIAHLSLSKAQECAWSIWETLG